MRFLSRNSKEKLSKNSEEINKFSLQNNTHQSIPSKIIKKAPKSFMNKSHKSELSELISLIKIPFFWDKSAGLRLCGFILGINGLSVSIGQLFTRTAPRNYFQLSSWFRAFVIIFQFQLWETQFKMELHKCFFASFY